MIGHYAAAFERDQGCTEAEWLAWLPGAVRGHALTLTASGGAARVDIDGGVLDLAWHPLPPRQIALVRLPRLAIGFRFTEVDEDARQRFMRYFDLYMQRGGG
ncbi:hypothetical protein [Sphaerotilus sp.]|uniref:hypothetical protein n=1 Tax=Sphaerotilus sp. TaxID=2093942 RepID=UPI00286E7860|nr:hypothetical protein [Sphaerotilus sp.]